MAQGRKLRSASSETESRRASSRGPPHHRPIRSRRTGAGRRHWRRRGIARHVASCMGGSRQRSSALLGSRAEPRARPAQPDRRSTRIYLDLPFRANHAPWRVGIHSAASRAPFCERFVGSAIVHASAASRRTRPDAAPACTSAQRRRRHQSDHNEGSTDALAGKRRRHLIGHSGGAWRACVSTAITGEPAMVQRSELSPRYRRRLQRPDRRPLKPRCR